MTPLALLIAATFAAVLIAGCHGEDESVADDWAYRIGGAFTEEATQDDLDGLRNQLLPYEVDLAVMESFPMRYQVNGIQAADCDAVRALLEEEPYVATVGDCRPIEDDAVGDERTTGTA